MQCFVGCTFTGGEPPAWLALGLVALDGQEHYVELDLATDWARGRIEHSMVLGQWGRVGSVCANEHEAGLRTAQWLLALRSATPIEIAFTFEEDFAQLQRLLRGLGRWDSVAELAPVDIAVIGLSAEGSYLAETCYRDLAARGLKRHHALADALALRDAYVGVTDTSVRMTRVVRSDVYRRLVAMLVGWADPAHPGRFDAEAWVQRWFLQPLIGFEGRRPLDILEEPDGYKQLKELLIRITFGVYS